MGYKHRNVYCEGFEPDKKNKNKTDLYLNFNNAIPKLNNIKFNIKEYAQAVINKDEYALDLIRIAVYVYIADCLTKRGTNYDPYDEDWNFPQNFFIPVLKPDFWNQSEIKTQLENALYFAVGHKYNFEFSEWQPNNRQMFLDLFSKETLKLDIDCISMFSGGIDSLYSSIKLLEQGRKPLLLSHRTTNKLLPFRDDLLKELKNDYGKDLRKWELAIHLSGLDAQEVTQRSRSFVYACLGISFAKCLNLKDVYLSDNGVVSFNLRSTNQNLNTLNTRSTNPKLIYSINQISKQIWKDNAPKVENLLLWDTKADVIKGLKTLNKSKLLPLTTSCVSTYKLTSSQPYCGECSQCVDRRFSAEWAEINLNENPYGYYKVDVFRDDLKEGIAKTHAENYYRKAKDILHADESSFLDFYSEIFGFCPDNEDFDEFFRKAYALHKRFSDQVFDVIGKFGKEYVKGGFSENSLISMIYRDGNKKIDLNDYKLPDKKDLVLIARQSKCLYKDTELDLTKKEFEIVYKLASNTGNYLSFEELIDNPNVYENEVAKEHKKNIINKLKKACRTNYIQLEKGFEFITNKRKVGYKLNLMPNQVEIR